MKKYKIGSFLPFKKRIENEKEKVRLDLEVVKSLRYKFRDDKELLGLFNGIINILLNKIRN